MENRVKRYRLKKDLPTFKAGNDGFYLDSEGNLMNRTGQAGNTVIPAPVLVRNPNILTDWFEEIPEKPKTVDDLNQGDRHYYMTACGDIVGDIWLARAEDIYRRDTGNCFLTKEDTEKEIARLKAKAILERDTKGFKPDWKNGDQYKWYALWDYSHLEFRTYAHHCDKGAHIYFATQEDIEASINAREKEWKIWLGVEE